jgi:hypothetical protein
MTGSVCSIRRWIPFWLRDFGRSDRIDAAMFCFNGG